MIQPPDAPTTRARSTNERSRSDSVWLRTTRAVDDQLVIPMTTTMTPRVKRTPNTDTPGPTISSMIGARISARTKVGMTRKKSVVRMSTASVDPPTNPDTMPTRTPMTTVTNVARRPIAMLILAP
jgi:hypothetical protein